MKPKNTMNLVRNLYERVDYCPRCNMSSMSKFIGEDVHGRCYEGQICTNASCVLKKGNKSYAIFVGNKSTKQGGGWKNYVMVGGSEYVLQLIFQDYKLLGYKIWRGQMYAPPFKYVDKS